MSTLFIFIRQVTSPHGGRGGRLVLRVHRPIQPIREAGLKGGRRGRRSGWGSVRAVVTATQALMLLWYCEASEGDEQTKSGGMAAEEGGQSEEERWR